MSSLVTSFIGFPEKTGKQDIVIAEMQSGTAQGLLGNTIIQFDNKIVDSHNQLILGTNAKFVCGVPGFYYISFALEIDWGGIGLAGAQLNVNNVTIKRAVRTATAPATTTYSACAASCVYPLNVGDVVEVAGFDSATASSLSSIVSGNYLQLARLPFYSEKSAVVYA